ncbi:MAG: hypothetical protein AB8G99_14210 [Planctomycetaceae bacterium]
MLYTRWLADAGAYRIVGEVMDAAGFVVPISEDITINPEARHHGPSVTGMSPMPGGTAYDFTNRVEINFSGAIDVSTLTPDNVRVMYSATGDFGDGTAEQVADAAIEWDATTNTAAVVTPDPLPNGESFGQTIVAESGSSDSFTVVLPVRPIGNVVFEVSSADESEATVSPVTLTFTSSNWDRGQSVLVQGIDDELLDGDMETS